jgi:hypothetical protein
MTWWKWALAVIVAAAVSVAAIAVFSLCGMLGGPGPYG